MGRPNERVLVLNAGSSTLKWSLLDATDERVVSEGTEAWNDAAREKQIAALRRVIASAGAVVAVGHRVVHGGALRRHAIVTADVRAAIATLVEIDPLHQQPALDGIDAVTAALPNTPQVAVFDTAFHSTLPDAAAVYALPAEWRRQWGLRRAGFHGLSVEWSTHRVSALHGKAPRRLLVVHLGSGSSLTAVRDGASLDTTMGASVLEGVIMGTRSGSVDPGVLLALQLQHGVDAKTLHDALQHRSGLLGLSEISSDLRKVIAAMDSGSAPATLAYACFVHSLVRHAGAMSAVLHGLDAIVFTGGIGEHSSRVRTEVLRALEFTGVSLDHDRNETTTSDGRISTDASRVKAYVVTAREEIIVLRAVKALLAGDAAT